MSERDESVDSTDSTEDQSAEQWETPKLDSPGARLARNMVFYTIIRLLLVLALTKMVVTAICFASGTPGGMFAPTLFVGAMLGGAIGAAARIYWPLPTSPPSAYVLVGMGTFFAAVFLLPSACPF